MSYLICIYFYLFIIIYISKNHQVLHKDLMSVESMWLNFRTEGISAWKASHYEGDNSSNQGVD